MLEKPDVMEKHANRRRDFLKKSGKIAVAAPAVALLLQAGMKPAFAAGYDNNGGGTGPTTTPPPITTEVPPPPTPSPP